jgi:hypothetical protein
MCGRATIMMLGYREAKLSITTGVCRSLQQGMPQHPILSRVELTAFNTMQM